MHGVGLELRVCLGSGPAEPGEQRPEGDFGKSEQEVESIKNLIF